MKMESWDTVYFKSYKEVVKYFKIESTFEVVFGSKIDIYKIPDKNKYKENSLINYCLNLIKSDSHEVWFSCYNEERDSFEINKIEISPKDKEDARRLMLKLKLYIEN